MGVVWHRPPAVEVAVEEEVGKEEEEEEVWEPEEGAETGSDLARI